MEIIINARVSAPSSRPLRRPSRPRWRLRASSASLPATITAGWVRA